MKKKMIFVLMVCCALMIFIFINVDDKNEFLDILNNRNVVVNGNIMSKMTEVQIEGFLQEISNQDIIEKYRKKIQEESGDVEVTPMDLLELHYYSLPDDEKGKFLEDIQNHYFNNILLIVPTRNDIKLVVAMGDLYENEN